MQHAAENMNNTASKCFSPFGNLGVEVLATSFRGSLREPRSTAL